MRLLDYCGSKVAISAPDDPRSRKHPARSTGKPGHNGRTGRPSGARHPDDPQSPRPAPPQNTLQGQPRRETHGPRDRDTPGTGNFKTNALYPPRMTQCCSAEGIAMLLRAAQRPPVRRSRHAPANDRGNFAQRGNKARVARAEAPPNAEFPRYGRHWRMIHHYRNARKSRWAKFGRRGVSPSQPRRFPALALRSRPATLRAAVTFTRRAPDPTSRP
jgi:hypothetical protein